MGFERVPERAFLEPQARQRPPAKGKMWLSPASLIQVGASRTNAESVKLLSITIIYFLIESHGKVW